METETKEGVPLTLHMDAIEVPAQARADNRYLEQGRSRDVGGTLRAPALASKK